MGRAIAPYWPSRLRPGAEATIIILFLVVVLAAMLVPSGTSPRSQHNAPVTAELNQNTAPETGEHPAETTTAHATPAQTAISPAASEFPTTSVHRSSPAASELPRTIVYWQSLMAILQSKAPEISGTDRQSTRNALHRLANELTSLSVVGVDEEPVEWALQASRLFRETADAESYLQSPQFLIYSFTQGANGRPFDGLQQAQSVQQQVQGRWRELSNRATEVRLQLSRRYGVDLKATF